MKSNFFKYIFITFILGIIILAIYFIYFKDKNETQVNEENNVEFVEEKKDLRLRYF